MHTYRDGVNWSGAEWPADAGQGDVTTWTYDEATGLLTAKTYADGQGVSYTYETGGNLNTRTWARTADGSPLITTYDYDPATGELTGIDYSDETPDIAFTYDRAGRKETVAGAAGNRTFVYDGVNLDMEIITGIYDRTIDYDYETAGVGMAGRPAGFTVGSDYLVEYGYESGRISGLNWQIGTHTGGAGYTYQDGLIHQLQYENGPTVTYTYDPVERYKTRVKNENASEVISQYDYTHDILGRRETVTYSGSAFLQGLSYRRFAYNDRSELIESSAYAGSDIADTNSPLPPEYRSYAYDPIGNRTTATDWDKTTETSQIIDYAANELNQYDQITAGTETDLPEYDADGNMIRISANDPLITYNGENRLTEAEYRVVTGDITGEGAVDLTDAVSALQVAAGMTPPDVTTDGDISSDGQIGIEEAVYALQVTAEMRIPAETSRKLVMAYDYVGRRVSKETFFRNELDTDWKLTPDKTVLFVYDGWNLVEEIEQKGAGESSRYYVWALDLSQSFEGAGGIGGLLASVDGDSSFRYLYDANGNVGQLVSAEYGGVSAHYEYDPYGKVIDSYGEYADANPFRFSTKYLDKESDMELWGKRYFQAKNGRWISRDPSSEEGGLNLYCFVHNSPSNYTDALGLSPWSVIVKQAAKTGIRKGISEYIENRIKKEILGSITNHAYKRAAKELGEEAIKVLDLLESQWWEIAIECIPVGGDIYGVGKLANSLREIDKRLENIEKKGLRLKENEVLVSRWDKGTYDSAMESVIDHARRKGHDVDKYLRKAANFNKKGARSKIYMTEHGMRKKWQRSDGEFVIETLDGKIVSYGKD